MLTTLGLAYLAGVLSTLSPCVLPLLPIVVGAAASEHRFGPVALAVGLATSFVLVGLFFATIGFAIGLDADWFRFLAAAAMIVVGAVLIIPSLQMGVAHAAGPLGQWGSRWFARLSGLGLGGQFCAGLLLGIVWTPCVGPTLGAVSILAAEGKELPQVAVTMLVFGLGALTPLLAVGVLSRAALAHHRARILSTSGHAKTVLGLGFVLIGAAVVTGADKYLETMLVDASPSWLKELTTRF